MNQYIDHTLLKPEASEAQIKVLCEEAKEFAFKSVCINPVNVSLAASLLKDSGVEICTVVGFPLGANTTAVKAFETEDALNNGATEIDMVINIGALKEGRIDYVREEIKTLKAIVKDKVLKVIIETCLLTKDEIRTASQLVVDAGADFVKTSTGFSTGGATPEDVRLMKETVGDKAEVKASGGVRSSEDMNAMLEAGATRIGASSGVQLMRGEASKSTY